MVAGRQKDYDLQDNQNIPKTDFTPWQYKDPVLQNWPDCGRVVIFDLEYTSWEGSWERGWSEDWEHREIVQVGAVLVDASVGFRQIDRFSRFVQPKLNSKLSEYFMDLTGISQSTVDCEGSPFAEAYSDFQQFVGDSDVAFSNGTDGEVLRENCVLNGLEYRFEFDRLINIRPQIAIEISQQVGQEYDSVDSGDLTRVLGIRSSNLGGKHDALADAEGIALALHELRRRGAI
jgi:inhibitor of KinA sporulation pathway (predicted exonuclease)